MKETKDATFDKVKETKDMALEKIEDVAQSLNTSVHSKRWRYIGGAALGGFLLGWLLRHK